MLAGRLNAARDHLNQSLAHLEKTPQGTLQPSYAMRLADLAMVHLKLDQPVQAKGLLEQAVGIAQRILPADDQIRRELERGLAVVAKQCEPPFNPGVVIVNAAN
jgi:hypothetical protein